MNNLLTAIIGGVVAFIATNIDDILILLVFFLSQLHHLKIIQF
jgi:cadmium resistance protein CadD (predicted permease)